MPRATNSSLLSASWRDADTRAAVHSSVAAIITAYIWYKVISYAVIFLIGFYAPRFRVGRLGWFSLNNVSWQGRRVWVEGIGEADHMRAKELEKRGTGERTKVQIGSIALRVGGWTEHGRRKWIVLRISKLRVKVPKAHLEPNKRESSDASEDDRNQSSRGQRSRILRALLNVLASTSALLKVLAVLLYRVLQRSPIPRAAGRVWCTLHDDVLAPVGARLNSLARRSGWVAALFSIDLIDVEVDVDRVCRTRFSFAAGIDALRGQRGRFCAWAALRNFELHQPEQSFARQSLAASIPLALELSAAAPLDPALGLSSLLDQGTRAVLFRQRSVDIQLSARELPASRWQKAAPARAAVFHVDALINIVASIPSRESSGPGRPQVARHRSEPPRTSRLTMLRSVRLQLPTIEAAWRYEGTPSQLAKNPAAPATAVVEVRLCGLHASLDLSEGTKEGIDVKRHVEWHGRGREALVQVSAGWTEVQAGLSLNGLPVSALSSPMEPKERLLHLGESSLHMTSSWLPRGLNDRLGRPSALTSLPSDDNVVLAIEGELGVLQGSVGIDDLTSLAMVLAVLSNSADLTTPPQPPQSDDEPPASHLLPEPPPLIACLGFAGVRYDVLGPSSPGPSPFGPGEDGDGQSEVRWQMPDSLCLEVDRLQLGVRVAYADLCLRRDEHQRRDARRAARRGKVTVPDPLKDIEVSSAHTRAILGDHHLDDASSVNSDGSSKVGGAYGAYPLPAASRRPHAMNQTEDVFRAADADFLCDVDASCAVGPSRLFLRSADEGAVFSALIAGEYDLISMGPAEARLNLKVAGEYDAERRDLPVLDVSKREGAINFCFANIDLDLSNPRAVSSLGSLIQAAGLRKAPHSAPTPPSMRRACRASILPYDLALYCAISVVQLRAASSDPKFEPEIERGLTIDAERLLFEAHRQSTARPGLYNFPDRQRLLLREDIRVQSNALGLQNPNDDAACLKASLYQIRLRPIAATPFKAARMQSPIPDSAADDGHITTWELKNRSRLVGTHAKRRQEAKSPREVKPRLVDDLLSIPDLVCRTTIMGPRAREAELDKLTINFNADAPIFAHIELRHLYSLFIVCSLLRHLTALRPPAAGAKTPQSPEAKSGRVLRIESKVVLNAIHIHWILAKVAPVFIELTRFELGYHADTTITAQWDRLRCYGRSVPHRGKWDDILGAKTCNLRIGRGESEGTLPLAMRLSGDTLRLRIPFKFVLAEIIDSVGTFVKATKQLAHQFLQGGLNSVIQPAAEPPKKLPELTLKFRILVVQAEDDPFETRLNAIWRAGCEEMNDRAIREEAFQAKVAELETVDAARFSDSGSSRSSLSSKSDHSRRRPSTPATDSEDDSPDATVSVDEAYRRLHTYNASAWVKRIRNATAEQARQEEIINRQLYGHVVNRTTQELPIDVIPPSKMTPLARLVITHVDITVSKPTFGPNGLADYLHDVGKGLPKDTKFTLLLPMHLEWRMAGATIRLRDFPLFLFHLPRPSETPTQPVWEMKTDLVIAEELAGSDSIRWAEAEVVGKDHATYGRPYGIPIPRTTNSVKTYALPHVRVNAPGPVRFGWGNSMQPAIQDLVRSIDSLSKPPADPSPRVGFWDKMRLILHWRVTIHFEGDSDVVLHLKGSRDPYQVLGAGAGYAKVWRGDVRFLIGHENKDREVWQITSRDYVLGIPNLKEYVDSAASGSVPTSDRPEDIKDDSSSSLPWSGHTNRSRLTDFLKVTAKLTNGVRWGLGIKLERTCEEGSSGCGCQGSSTFHRECRFFDFIPHYKVVLRSPEYVLQRDGRTADSYGGFRSDFIHFSLSITSPTTEPSRSHPEHESFGEGRRNSFHFSPESSTHFFLWWKTFDSALSLPIRQGKLFPSAQPPSKKFGRHVATLKYAFRIYPLFFAHTYKQDATDDWIAGRCTVIGVKARIDRFHADLHQRATELTVRNEKLDQMKKVIRKVFYSAEVDCMANEIRGLTATFTSSRKAAYAMDANLSSLTDQDEIPPLEETPPLLDRDKQWLDLDDFNDLMFSLPSDEPALRLYDAATCPRISYLRRPTASPREADGDGQSEMSKFGEEDSHSCLIGSAKDAMSIQLELLDQRIEELEDEQTELRRCDSERQRQKAEELRGRLQAVQRLRHKVAKHVDSYVAERGAKRRSHDSCASAPLLQSDVEDQLEEEEERLKHVVKELYDKEGSFVNRLLVHSFSLLLSNSTRDILLKYHYSTRGRKGFMYHLSPQLIKFINELSDGTHKSERDRLLTMRRKSRVPGISHNRPGPDAEAIIDLLKNGQHSVATVEMEPDKNPGAFSDTPENLAERDIPEDFVAQAAELILLMRPQIAFKSEADDTSTVIVTAFQAQLKSFNILDIACLDDPVNARVLRRSFATVTGVQAFYPTSGALTSNTEALQRRMWHYDFVPVEVLVDLHLEPWGFDRLLPRSSASVRYDKFNQLRIKKQARSSFEKASQDHLRTSTDWIKVDADTLSVTADPQHFRAIYNVVTDLLLYTDPNQKERNAAIETMLYTFGVENLGGIADEIISRQASIRRDRRVIVEDQTMEEEYDENSIGEFMEREYRLWRHSDELGLLVQAIQRSQMAKTSAGRDRGTSVSAQLDAFARHISWFMNGESSTPIAKFTVDNTKFEWRAYTDSSVQNRLAINNMVAFNVSPNPNRTFDEILSKHEDPSEGYRQDKSIFKAIWKTLPPVGGIAIVDTFEMKLHPIRLQIDYEEGVQIFNYVFGATKPAPHSARDEDDDHRTRSDRREPSESGRSIGSGRSPSRPGRRSQSTDDSGSAISPMQSRESLVPSAKSSEGRPPPSRSSSGTFLHTNWRVNAGRATSIGSRSGKPSGPAPMTALSSEGSRAPSPHRNGNGNATPASSGSRPKVAHSSTAQTLLTLTKRENKNAEEMKRRAREYRTFLLINVEPTVLVLSYKGPKYLDVYGLTIRSPALRYQSRTWSYQDFFDQVKGEVTSSILKQTPQLISQFIATAHKNTAIPKKVGKNVARGLGGLKLRVTKATAERMAKASSSQEQAEVLEDTLDGDGQRSRKESGSEGRGGAAGKVTSPLRFSMRPPEGGTEEEVSGKGRGEVVEMAVEGGGPEGSRAPLLTKSVLGGQAMVVEEPEELGDGEVGEMEDQVGEGPPSRHGLQRAHSSRQSISASQAPRESSTPARSQSTAPSTGTTASTSTSSSSGSGFFHRHSHHPQPRDPRQDGGTDDTRLSKQLSIEEAKAKAKLLLGRSYDHTTK